MMMPLEKMSGGFLSPAPIFVLEDKDSLSGQDCYVLHSMHACNACMAEVHLTWVQTRAQINCISVTFIQ
jgi:hypothetical protein